MSQGLPSNLKARWSDGETDALVEYLMEHRSKCGDGANFKNTTFQATATHLVPLLQDGKPKDAKSVKYKWSQVCLLIA